MKKVSFGLLTMGIILVLIPILFPNILNKSSKHIEPSEINNNSNPSNSDTTNKNIEWEVLYGNEKISYNTEYTKNNLTEEYFYSTNESHSKYAFSIPQGELLTKVAYFSTYYFGEIVIEYGDNNITDINEYANKSINNFSNYNKFYIRKALINDNKIAIDLRALNTSTNEFFEELKILYKNTDNNYSYIKYQILNSVLTDNFIEKLIDNFKIKEAKSSDNVCNKNGNIYECNIMINNINKLISFTVDAKKYDLTSSLSHDNYQVSFVNNIPLETDKDNTLDESVYISFILSDNVKNTLNDVLNISNSKKLTISGKKLQKYDLTKDQIYRSYYIFDFDNNLSMFLDIESTENNTDEIVKDFINFKLSNR